MTLYNPTPIDRFTLGTAAEMNADRAKVKSAIDALETLVTSIAEGSGILNYTWIAYADSADGTSNFTTGAQEGRPYLGMAFNKPSATPGTDPTDYDWYLFASSATIFQSVPDGSLSNPGFAFGLDKDTGLFRSASGTIDVVCNGVRQARFSPAGLHIPSNLTVEGTLKLGGSDDALVYRNTETGSVIIRVGAGESLRYYEFTSDGKLKVNGSEAFHVGNLTNLNQLANGPGYITTDGRAYPRRYGGQPINFLLDGVGGTPTWVWGGIGDNDWRVYSPANFSVNFANSAGNADTVDGYHASALVKYSDLDLIDGGDVGYKKLANGDILQWVRGGYGNSEGAFDLYWAVAFTQVFTAWITKESAYWSPTDDSWFGLIGAPGNAYCQISRQYSGNVGGGSSRPVLFGIGRI